MLPDSLYVAAFLDSLEQQQQQKGNLPRFIYDSHSARYLQLNSA